MFKYFYTIVFLFSCHGLFCQSWNESDFLSSTRIDDISFIDENIGFAGQSSTLYKTNNQGKNWSLIAFDNRFSYIRSIDFLDSLTGFVGTLRFGSDTAPGLFRTSDGGTSFEKVLSIGNNEGICGIAHHEDVVVAIGTFAGPAKLYKSTDRGLTFSTINLSQWLSGAVDCHMVGKDTIFVAGNSSNATSKKPMIIVSTDGGATWRESLKFNSKGAGYIWKMHFDADNHIFASVEIVNTIADKSDNVMFVSQDMGESWESYGIVENTRINYGGIGIMPNGKGWIGDQHDNSFYETQDGGKTWSLANSFVPSCNRIHVFKNGNAVAAGRTVYYYEAGTSETQNPKKYDELKFDMICTPNPAHNYINLTLMAGAPTFGVVEIYSLNGQIVYTGQETGFDEGETDYNVKVQELSAGSYVAVWKTSHRMVSKRFVKQ